MLNLLTTIDTERSKNNEVLLDKSKEELMDMLSPIYSGFYRYIFSLAKNKELTEDIMQNALLLAYENIHKLKDKSKFKSWFFTIGRNEFLKLIRNNSNIVDQPLEKIDSGINLESTFIQSDNIIEIMRIINGLSDEDRLIFLLRQLGELQFKQIACALEINDSTARIRYKRIRERIGQIYNKMDQDN